MIDYSKVYFNEMDDTVIPVQYFFGYDLTEQELAAFITYYIPEMPDDKETDTAELCVSRYSHNDWKVEFISHNTDGTTDWFELLPNVTECDAFMEIVPADKRITEKRENNSYEQDSEENI